MSVCTIFKAQASDPQLGVQRFLEWLAYHETVGVQVYIDTDHRRRCYTSKSISIHTNSMGQ